MASSTKVPVSPISFATSQYPPKSLLYFHASNEETPATRAIISENPDYTPMTLNTAVLDAYCCPHTLVDEQMLERTDGD